MKMKVVAFHLSSVRQLDTHQANDPEVLDQSWRIFPVVSTSALLALV
ncbi:hypothetical protein IQ243_22270 [Nostocales cyanobacterium LEGE 11386]|nr:hypothetical protein [Nostocales cyanobacterium LEGE 11386]